jgi:hypothetical protein
MRKGRDETFGNETPFQCCASIVMVLPVLFFYSRDAKSCNEVGRKTTTNKDCKLIT